MLDYKILKNVNSVSDFQRAEEEFQLKKQIAQSQIDKANQIDVDKLGEVAFMKAAMGEKLTPQEEAAARYVDAKSGGIMFNPATGAIQQKPRISDKIGLGGIGESQPQPQIQGYSRVDQLDILPESRNTPTNMQVSPPSLEMFQSGNQEQMQNLPEFERKFQQQLSAARGNPKLQQSIKETFAKEKIQYDENQAKAAGFAERMMQSNSIFDDPAVLESALSLSQRAAGSVPVFGNYMVSDDYQKFDQAQRDFINAQLRRESGAVISPEEFSNARKQYLPQPGDSQAVIKQKAKNRQAALRAMGQSAGAAYEEVGGTSNTINWEDLP